MDGIRTMNLNRLLAKIHFSDQFLQDAENEKKSKEEFVELLSEKLDAKNNFYSDAYLAVRSLVRFNTIAFNNDTLEDESQVYSRIKRKDDMVDFLNSFKGKELEVACIVQCAENALLLRYSEYSDYSNALYDDKHQLKKTEEILNIWLKERPMDKGLVEEYLLSGCLDGFVIHIRKLGSLYDFKSFEDFIQKK